MLIRRACDREMRVGNGLKTRWIDAINRCIIDIGIEIRAGVNS